jgi:hypothetical protein
MHHGPTDSGIFAVREMILQEEVDEMLLTGEYPVKRGSILDNAGEAKQGRIS